MRKITYHPKFADDMDVLPRIWQRRVMAVIDSKLISDPATYGKPLRHELWPYYKLRIGDYRVIYLIEKKDVYVLLVQHRRKVYREARKRVSKQ